MAVSGKIFAYSDGAFRLVDRTFAHAVGDCLATYRGSQALSPGYGSRILDLVDSPLNGTFQVGITRECATALRQAIPDVKLVKASCATEEGRVGSVTCVFADGSTVVTHA